MQTYEEKLAYNRRYNQKWRDELHSCPDLNDPRHIKLMLKSAKTRAKRLGLPFDLKPSDIVIPKRCPALGILLSYGRGRLGGFPHSPSLDRIVPSKGYIKDNVVVISLKANMIKSDATAEQVLRVGRFFSEL